MKPARHAVAAIFNDVLKKTLTSTGFLVDPLGFRRARHDIVEMVHVHIDDVYGPTGRFHLRVGVFHARIRRLLSQPVIEQPGEVDCTLRKRFGPDGDSTRGDWIVGDPQHPVSVIKEQLGSVWRSTIEPWLAMAGDLRALNSAIEAGAAGVPEKFVSVAVALAVDDKAAAQRRLDAAFREVTADSAEPNASSKRDVINTARLAAVHGLIDPSRTTDA